MRARIFTTLLLVSCSIGADAQDATDDKADARSSQEISRRVIVIQRLTSDTKMAEQLELAPDQRKKIMIAMERFQDATRKLYSNNSAGFTTGSTAYRELAEKFFSEAEESLTARQREKLGELEIQPRRPSRPSLSREELQESRKLQSLLSEMWRVLYDRELAESLEVTPTQRVEIREAQQKLMEVQRERTKSAAEGGGIDLRLYNESIEELMFEAQEILTPKQVESLARSAKLKRLKSSYGDEFGMIVGLADDFEMDDEARSKLREKVQEARKEYYDSIEQLKVDTLEEVVGFLPAKYREEAREAAEQFFEEEIRRRQLRERVESRRTATPVR